MSLNVSQHYKARALVFGGGAALPGCSISLLF